MMDGLPAMIIAVRQGLSARGVQVGGGYYINSNRNYILTTTDRPFLLKWNKEEFRQAGFRVPELGKGPGMTISLPVVKDAVATKPYMLFATGDSSIIYGKDFSDFMRLSGDYEQYSGEWVRVILTKSLDKWWVQ